MIRSRRAGRGATGVRAVSSTLFLAIIVALAFAAPALAKTKITSGFADIRFDSTNATLRDQVFSEARAARSSIARIDVSWAGTAPASKPANPRDPGVYNFSKVDAAVDSARSHGLKPLLTVRRAPRWAEPDSIPGWAPPGTYKPSGGAFNDYGHAIAAHFGSKVKYYQAWNEPNLYSFLNPQGAHHRNASVGIYRKLLNGFYKGVKSARGKAKVLSAGLAPYGGPLPGAHTGRTRPLTFARRLLCLKGRTALKPKKCPSKAKFNIFADNAITTSGGPGRSAINPNDVSSADVHNVVRTLRAAERHHRTSTSGHHDLWVTEFWWETNVPGQCGRPSWTEAQQGKWVGQAMRSFKRQGASVAINYLVRDDGGTCGYRSGIEANNGDHKPSFASFRSASRR